MEDIIARVANFLSRSAAARGLFTNKLRNDIREARARRMSASGNEPDTPRELDFETIVRESGAGNPDNPVFDTAVS